MTDEQENARWAELAKQLGLDGSRPSAPPPPATESQIPSAVTPMAEPVSVEAEETPDLPTDATDEGPSRRRGRGRGRKRSGNDIAPASESAREKDERGRKRRKSRRPTPADDEPSDRDEPERRSSSEIDDDDDDTANMSEWNVPTWADLIDSLYRPDR